MSDLLMLCAYGLACCVGFIVVCVSMGAGFALAMRVSEWIERL